MRDRLNIEYEPNHFISMDIGKNDDDLFHFAGVDIKPNETYIEAICRTTPLRQRALWGLALRLMSLRLQEKYREEADILIEYSRLYHMTDEEYDLEVLRGSYGL